MVTYISQTSKVLLLSCIKYNVLTITEPGVQCVGYHDWHACIVHVLHRLLITGAGVHKPGAPPGVFLYPSYVQDIMG